MIDIGGETTEVVIFIDGSVAYSSVVPIGSRHITSDMAVGLRISLESAEKIKVSLGKNEKTPALSSVLEEERTKLPKKKEEEFLDIKALGLVEDIQKISKKSVVDGIIKPRLQEIFKYVGKELKKSGFGTQIPSGLVISGGGALTIGVVEQAKYVLGFPARLGVIEGLSGMIDEIDSPAFASAAGLILYASTKSNSGEMHIPVLSGSLPLKGVIQKGIAIIKSFLP